MLLSYLQKNRYFRLVGLVLLSALVARALLKFFFDSPSLVKWLEYLISAAVLIGAIALLVLTVRYIGEHSSKQR